MFGLSKKYVDYILNTIYGSHEILIQNLNRSIEDLRVEVARERRRADLAVDQLLASQGKQTVMPEKIHFPTPEEAKAASERVKAAELLRAELEKVGDTGTFPDEVHGASTIEEAQ